MPDSMNSDFQEAARNLNRYYVDAKYPPGIPYWPPKEEAQTALNQARAILAFTRNKLITTD